MTPQTLETLAAENQRLRRQIAACKEALEKTHDYFEQAASCYDSGHPRAAAHAASLCRGAMAEILDEGGSEEPSPAPQPDAQDEKCEPEWTCTECGSMEGFKDIIHDTMDGREYDIECEECGCRLIAESPADAVHMMAQHFDGERAKLESQIFTLTAERDALRSRAEWVRCSDRMPGRDEPVILFIPNLQPPIAGELYFYENSRWETAVKGEPIWECLTPTHWMTLPPPPNDGQATVAETGSLLPTPLDPAPTTGKEDVK